MTELLETKIIAGLAHEESCVRNNCMDYFWSPLSDLAAAAPTIIQAANTYGWYKAFDLSQIRCKRLVQNDLLFESLMQAVREPPPLYSHTLHRLHDAMTIGLATAPLEIQAKRRRDLFAALESHQTAWDIFIERLDLAMLGDDVLWEEALAIFDQLETDENGLAGPGTNQLTNITDVMASRPEMMPLLLNILEQPPEGETLEMFWARYDCAIRTLGHMRAVQAVEPLLQLLLTPGAHDLSNATICALGRIGDDSVVNGLLRHWDKSSFSFKSAAAETLGLIPTRTALDAALQLLSRGKDDLSEPIHADLIFTTLQHFSPQGVELALGYPPNANPQLASTVAAVAIVNGMELPQLPKLLEQSHQLAQRKQRIEHNRDQIEAALGRLYTGSIMPDMPLLQQASANLSQEEVLEALDDALRDPDSYFPDDSPQDDDDDFVDTGDYAKANWRQAGTNEHTHPPDDDVEPPLKILPIIAEAKPGRNAPCPCGSGKKYKKCCGNK